MTTIAYRAGVMAGDGRETSWEKGESTFIIRDDSVKIYRLPDGRLFGAARTSEDIARLYDALLDSCKDGCNDKWPCPKLEDINAICVDMDGAIRVYEGRRWETVDMEYYSVGSGSRMAFPLLDAGLSAEDAVKIAVRRDPYSGGKIMVLKLRP